MINRPLLFLRPTFLGVTLQAQQRDVNMFEKICLINVISYLNDRKIPILFVGLGYKLIEKEPIFRLF